MKIVTAALMSELESKAYQQGCSEEQFMENAGIGIAEIVHEFIQDHFLDKHVLLLCGKGNNGGDAFVAGRQLLDKGCQVSAIFLTPVEDSSSLCKKNYQRFVQSGGKVFSSFLEDFSSFSVIIDGIFGTGFKGQVKDPYATLIKRANAQKIPIFAVDIPSGLNGTTGSADENTTIHATFTISLGLPKTGFIYEDGWNYIGFIKNVEFGLPEEIVEHVSSKLELTTLDDLARLLPPIKRNRHKYQAGQVIGLGGSPGMPGASLLSSLAALRGGCGMIRLLHPKGMEAELSASFPELIKVPYEYDKPQDVLELMQKGQATFVGPGLGRSDQVAHLLKTIMPQLEKPCVIDADALTLLAAEAFEIPKQTILTPHTGEMQRLLHSEEKLRLNPETLQACQKYADDHALTLVLKGAPTCVFHPGQPIFVNPMGNPGMATAGSGDVLTGLLASLLAQGLSCHQAAVLGAGLHGLAGEYAAMEKTSYSMIASDITNHFSSAIKFIL